MRMFINSQQTNLGNCRQKSQPFARKVPFSCRSPNLRAKAVQQESSFKVLEDACNEYKRAPPSEKQEYSIDILNALEKLKSSGTVKKWGSAELPERVNVFQGELKRVGVKNTGAIATPTVRNERAFLITTVGVTSVLAVAAGFLPGDWGFFVPYLTGGISIVVLALGSTAPGLLGFAIDRFSSVFPDYRERVLGHEAAHFLIGYLLGVPVAAYSLYIGQAHTDFVEAKLQKRLIERQLDDSEIDQLALISMAGVAAEAQNYEERWAVYNACSYLRSYTKEYEALKSAMGQGLDVPSCIQAIEAA